MRLRYLYSLISFLKKRMINMILFPICVAVSEVPAVYLFVLLGPEFILSSGMKPDHPDHDISNGKAW
jgi:hypothetical protein